MRSPEKDGIFELIARLKAKDRDALSAMDPGEAQRAVDAILHPELWRVAVPEQLDWPGDLADDDG
jgi:hypothetical protein